MFHSYKKSINFHKHYKYNQFKYNIIKKISYIKENVYKISIHEAEGLRVITELIQSM